MGVGSCTCVSANLEPLTHIEVLPAVAGACIACTLGKVDLADRAQAFAAVFEHLVATDRLSAGFRWTFRNAPGVERRLRELARREHACCPFLTFSVSVQGDRLLWQTCGSEEAEAVIETFYGLPAEPGRILEGLPSVTQRLT